MEARRDVTATDPAEEPIQPDRTMREFLVEITTTVPDGTGQDEVDSRRTAEAVRAKELAATGNLARLWRPVDEPRSIGIWRAADEEELHVKVLGTLPLRPWMTLTVTPLESHPNDPGPRDGAR
ncbi:muconolactone Delta-isomerase family protein [Actinopolymorpha pittospori]